MIILGIDPGSRATGYAVIKVENKKIQYLDSGTVKLEKLPTFFDRLTALCTFFQDLTARQMITDVAFESLIHVKNVNSLAKLSQARGAIVGGLSSCQARFVEYAPNVIKATVAGHGHADKSAVEKILTMMMGTRKFQTHDESDALAIAVCHALCHDKPSQLAGSRGRRGNRMRDLGKNLSN